MDCVSNTLKGIERTWVITWNNYENNVDTCDDIVSIHELNYSFIMKIAGL